MTVDPFLVWNIVLSFIIVPFGWAFGKMFSEVKRLQLHLNDTRETYATKSELNNEARETKEAIIRLEQKLDRMADRWSSQ
tara:strand:- start:536 stop:775 length:240 start_codon:yes stop_codon:yes gene_type:complete